MSKRSNNLSRRGFLATAAAAATMRGIPQLAHAPKARVILKLVYDKSLGMMRAVERLVH